MSEGDAPQQDLKIAKQWIQVGAAGEQHGHQWVVQLGRVIDSDGQPEAGQDLERHQFGVTAEGFGQHDGRKQEFETEEFKQKQRSG